MLSLLLLVLFFAVFAIQGDDGGNPFGAANDLVGSPAAALMIPVALALRAHLPGRRASEADCSVFRRRPHGALTPSSPRRDGALPLRNREASVPTTRTPATAPDDTRASSLTTSSPLLLCDCGSQSSCGQCARSSSQAGVSGAARDVLVSGRTHQRLPDSAGGRRSAQSHGMQLRLSRACRTPHRSADVLVGYEEVGSRDHSRAGPRLGDRRRAGGGSPERCSPGHAGAAGACGTVAGVARAGTLARRGAAVRVGDRRARRSYRPARELV